VGKLARKEAMTLQINPLSDVMGAEITGLTLKNDLDPETVELLNRALSDHIVVCIRDQHLEATEFIEVSKLFGTPVTHTNTHLVDKNLPALNWVSSEDRDIHGSGKVVYRGSTWHTDHSFATIPPKATILYAVKVPSSGGDTSFCNLRKAYAALPEKTKKRIDGMKALHVYRSSRSPRNDFLKLSEEEKKATPDSEQPLVRLHVDSGEKNLFLSTTRLECIAGLERSESDALLDSLFAHADDSRFHYHHKWRTNDYVIWDDRCSMHHANPDWPEGDKRFLYRTIIEGEKPVLASLGG
jgi:taurine dioxygenase